MGSTQATSSKTKTTEQLCADRFYALLESTRRVDVENTSVFSISSTTTPDGETAWSCDGAFDITETDANNTIRAMKRAANNEGGHGSRDDIELWYNQKIDNTNEELDIWVYTRRG